MRWKVVVKDKRIVSPDSPSAVCHSPKDVLESIALKNPEGKHQWHCHRMRENRDTVAALCDILDISTSAIRRSFALETRALFFAIIFAIGCFTDALGECFPPEVRASQSASGVSASVKPLPRSSPASFLVCVSIPQELSTYTGLVPVTFGVPFPQGQMKATDKHRLLIPTSNEVLDADFSITGSWPDGSVKWLLVDALVSISNKRPPPPIHLEYGPLVIERVPTQPIVVTETRTMITVQTNRQTYTFTKQVLPPMKPSHAVGRFDLTTVDLPKGVAKTFTTEAETTHIEVEKAGKIRTTLKLSGEYRNPDGTTFGRFTTRIRFYAQTPYTRLYHTMVWTGKEDHTGIASLAFVPKTKIGPGVQYAYSVNNQELTTSAIDLFQTDAHTLVADPGPSPRGRFDGWVEARMGPQKVFTALRWPWQQYPVRLEAGKGGMRLHAIGPRTQTPMSLAPKDLVSPQGAPMFLERYEEDGQINLREHSSNDPLWHPAPACLPAVCEAGDTCGVDEKTGEKECITHPIEPHKEQGEGGTPLSPYGVGKTYELLAWESNSAVPASGHVVSPQHKNALLQTPIYAYADPVQSVKANLPNPVSARNVDSFPTIETAIENAFDWVTRQRQEEGDYGTFNFGDLQYDWYPDPSTPGHFLASRYWLNQGKGWSTVPWLLYLRSGDRKYLENGEAHARHLMDVDTCHETDLDLLKFKGGVLQYHPIHFGTQTYPSAFLAESEYLGLYYHLTGYERAKEIIGERVEALLTESRIDAVDRGYSWSPQQMLNSLSSKTEMNPFGNDDWPVRFNREHYRTLGELAILYEETGNDDLKDLAEKFVAKLEASQATNGWLPGLKTNHWFSDSLTIAHRALGPQHATKIFEIVKKYEDHIGNYLMPSIDDPEKRCLHTEKPGTEPGKLRTEPGKPCTVNGPTSLWTLVVLEQGSGNPQYLEVAAKTALAQALSVYPDEGDWRGFTSIPVQYLGSQIRGWTATMARLSQLRRFERLSDLAPISYFLSGLTTRLPEDGGQWEGRHVFYILDQSDREIRVDLDFIGAKSHRYDLKFRIYTPNGEERESRGFFMLLPTNPDNFHYYDTPPLYDTTTLSSYRKGTTIRIPKDNQTGVYAIEVLSVPDPREDKFEPAVWARSSEGKLVHYMPNFWERGAHISPRKLYYDYKKDGGTVVAGGDGPSHAYSGQFWFMPISTSRQVTLGFFSGTFSPLPELKGKEFPFVPNYYVDAKRIVAFRPTLTDGCRTTITGTDALGNPQMSPCTFTPTTLALHSAVVTNTHWNYSLHTESILPFFSSTEAEWFNPWEIKNRPRVNFLVPRD